MKKELWRDGKYLIILDIDNHKVIGHQDYSVGVNGVPYGGIIFSISLFGKSKIECHNNSKIKIPYELAQKMELFKFEYQIARNNIIQEIFKKYNILCYNSKGITINVIKGVEKSEGVYYIKYDYFNIMLNSKGEWQLHDFASKRMGARRKWRYKLYTKATLGDSYFSPCANVRIKLREYKYYEELFKGVAI